MHCYCLCLILVLLAIYNSGLVSADVPDQASIPADFNRMRTKELKQFLAERGLSCKGCSEKKEFVDMAEANRDTPLKDTDSTARKFAKSEKASQSNMDDILEALKKSGLGGGAKVFTADDLKNMNFDEMRDSSNTKQKRTRKRPEVKEAEKDDTIEL